MLCFIQIPLFESNTMQIILTLYSHHWLIRSACRAWKFLISNCMPHHIRSEWNQWRCVYDRMLNGSSGVSGAPTSYNFSRSTSIFSTLFASPRVWSLRWYAYFTAFVTSLPLKYGISRVPSRIMPFKSYARILKYFLKRLSQCVFKFVCTFVAYCFQSHLKLFPNRSVFGHWNAAPRIFSTMSRNDLGISVVLPMFCLSTPLKQSWIISLPFLSKNASSPLSIASYTWKEKNNHKS